MERYQVFLINNALGYMIGAAAMEPTSIDFEDDEEIQDMINAANETMVVDAVYHVTVCGYPALWLNVHEKLSDVSASYLYISTEENLYYLMYTYMPGDSPDVFLELVQSVAIGDQKEGTDISVVTE